MLARRSERNRSRPLIRLRNERPAICAFSRRKRPGVVCGSPQTRKRFEESLRVRRYQIERTLLNEVLVVAAFITPFIITQNLAPDETLPAGLQPAQRIVWAKFGRLLIILQCLKGRFHDIEREIKYHYSISIDSCTTHLWQYCHLQFISTHSYV